MHSKVLINKYIIELLYNVYGIKNKSQIRYSIHQVWAYQENKDMIPTVVLLLAGIHLISAQMPLDNKYIPPAIIHGNGSISCPSGQQRASSRQELKESLRSTLGLQPPHQCGTGMWTRIAYLNMTDPLQSCPPAWRQNTANGVRVCGRPITSNNMCHGTF